MLIVQNHHIMTSSCLFTCKTFVSSITKKKHEHEEHAMLYSWCAKQNCDALNKVYVLIVLSI